MKSGISANGDSGGIQLPRLRLGSSAANNVVSPSQPQTARTGRISAIASMPIVDAASRQATMGRLRSHHQEQHGDTQRHRGCCAHHHNATTAVTSRPRPAALRRNPDAPEPIPMHCGISDLCQWFDRLEYDERTEQQRQQIQRAEEVEAERLRRIESVVGQSKSIYMKLSELSPALRTDLHILVTYMLEWGTRCSRDYYPVVVDATPSKDVYMQLRDLFDFLDFDHGGTVSFDEMRRVCEAIGRTEFGIDAFRKIDVDRSGSINFIELLKAFFPKTTTRFLKSVHEEFDKMYENGRLTARKRLSAESLHQIQRHYDALVKMDGGCTARNLLVSMHGLPPPGRKTSPAALATEKALAEIFPTFDGDGDGKLNFDEFIEFSKLCYPPYSSQLSGKSPLASIPWLIRRTDRDYNKVPKIPDVLPRAPFVLASSRQHKAFTARLIEKPALQSAFCSTSSHPHPPQNLATQNALSAMSRRLLSSMVATATLSSSSGTKSTI